MVEFSRLEQLNVPFFIIIISSSILILLYPCLFLHIKLSSVLSKIDDDLGISAKCLECAVGLFYFENKY